MEVYRPKHGQEMLSSTSSKELLETGYLSYLDFNMENDHRRFLKSYGWKGDFEGMEYIFDKSLYEFPIFGLNSDYLKSIANVFYGKLREASNISSQLTQLLEAPVRRP